MRWDQLFADLEAQLAVLERAELAGEVAEHTRAERAQVLLADRLLAAVGEPVRLQLQGLGWLDVRLRDLGKDWLLVEVEGAGTAVGRSALSAQVLAPTAAVSAVEGLGRRADPDRTGASRRFGLGHALRGISRDRAVVRVHDIGGDHCTGTVDRVLADHLDLARHPDDGVARPGEVRGIRSIPFASLAAVRRM